MASAAGNFALRQLGLGWVTAPDRLGHLTYMGASMLASTSLNFMVHETSKGMFPEKPTLEDQATPLSSWGIKPIKTMDDLTEKVFQIAVAIALIIPVAIFAREAVIYMGYQHLSMVTTPLLTLFKEEVIDLLVAETILAFLALALDSST